MQPYRPFFTTSKVISGLSCKLITGIAVLLASGCTSPSYSVVVKLEVSELGAYSVDGSLVERAALKDALLAKRRNGKKLLIHIVPSSKAKYEAVEAAVKAVQDSGASLGMVGNERF